MSLGAGALKLMEWEVINRGERGIHGNPLSGHHQRHCHNEIISGIFTNATKVVL